DALRQVVGLRAYAQRDPLNEYKTEAFGMFEAMLGRVRDQVTTLLAHVQLQTEAPPPALEEPDLRELRAQHVDPITGENDAEPAALAGGPAQSRRPAEALDPNDPATWGRISRNAPCPCGSGKKFKHCHGAL